LKDLGYIYHGFYLSLTPLTHHRNGVETSCQQNRQDSEQGCAVFTKDLLERLFPRRGREGKAEPAGRARIDYRGRGKRKTGIGIKGRSQSVCVCVCAGGGNVLAAVRNAEKHVLFNQPPIIHPLNPPGVKPPPTRAGEMYYNYDGELKVRLDHLLTIYYDEVYYRNTEKLIYEKNNRPS
jgi:hypothetical protein